MDKWFHTTLHCVCVIAHPCVDQSWSMLVKGVAEGPYFLLVRAACIYARGCCMWYMKYPSEIYLKLKYHGISFVHNFSLFNRFAFLRKARQYPCTKLQDYWITIMGFMGEQVFARLEFERDIWYCNNLRDKYILIPIHCISNEIHSRSARVANIYQ